MACVSMGDHLYCPKTDKAIFKKIYTLIKDTLRNPFSGIGKPEPLVGNYKGYWSKALQKRTD